MAKQNGFCSVEEEWEEYACRIFGGMTVSREQYSETKKAFFAGFTALMFQLRQINEGMPDNVAADHLDELLIECTVFAAFQKGLGVQNEMKEG